MYVFLHFADKFIADTFENSLFAFYRKDGISYPIYKDDCSSHEFYVNKRIDFNRSFYYLYNQKVKKYVISPRNSSKKLDDKEICYQSYGKSLFEIKLLYTLFFFQ